MKCHGLSLASVLTAGLLLSGCAAAPAQTFGRPEADSVRQLVQSFAAAYNQKNASELASLFSGSGALMPPNSAIIRGTDGIASFYEIRFKEGATDLEIEASDVGGHGPLAFISGHYRLRLESEDGPGGRDRGKFLWILRNYAGQWRFDYQMWSSDLPPGGPPGNQTS